MAKGFGKDRDYDKEIQDLLKDKEKITSTLQDLTKKIVEKSFSSNEKIYRELQSVVRAQREQLTDVKRMSEEGMKSQDLLDEIVSSGISASPKELKALIARVDSYSQTVEAILKDDELELVRKQLIETKKFLAKDYKERASLLAKTNKILTDKVIEKTTTALSVVTMLGGTGTLTGIAIKFVGDQIIDRMRAAKERKSQAMEQQKNDTILMKEELERIRQEKMESVERAKQDKKRADWEKDFRTQQDANKADKKKTSTKKDSGFDGFDDGFSQSSKRSEPDFSQQEAYKNTTSGGFVRYGFEDGGDDMFTLPKFNDDDDSFDPEDPTINRISKSSGGNNFEYQDSESAVQIVELGSKVDVQTNLLQVIVEHQKLQTRYLADLVLSNDEMLERQELTDFKTIEAANESGAVRSPSLGETPSEKSAIANALGTKENSIDLTDAYVGFTAISSLFTKFGPALLAAAGPILAALQLIRVGSDALGITGKTGQEYGTSDTAARMGNALSKAGLGIAGDGQEMAQGIQRVRDNAVFEEAINTRQQGMEVERDVAQAIENQKKRLIRLREQDAKESVLQAEEAKLNDYQETLIRLQIENQKLFHQLLIDSGAAKNLMEAKAIQVGMPSEESLFTKLRKKIFGGDAMRVAGAKVITEEYKTRQGQVGNSPFSRQNTSTGPGSYSGTGTVGGGGKGVSKYEEMIQRIAKEENVDPDLVRSMMKQESGGNPNAVSNKGAGGLMQIMPGTAAEVGVDNVFDPEQNIRGGARYIRKQLDKYNGNVELALAAYNAGPGAVDKYNGVPPYAETQGYVKSIGGRYMELKKNQSADQLEAGAKELALNQYQTPMANPNVGIQTNKSSVNHNSTNFIVSSTRNDESTLNQLELSSRGFGGF